jgi:hypothetical protein
MKLSPPRNITRFVATFLGFLGIVDLPLISPYAFWLVALAFVLLFLGTLLPGI